MLLSLVALALAQSAGIPITTGLGVSGVSIGARAPTGIDTVQSQIVEGKWQEPRPGDSVPGARGADRTWTEVKANKDGVFEGGPTQGGYVYATIDSDVEKPMLLTAAGDSMVYINGEPRGGDPYSYGYLKLPFLMKKGHNTFLFSCGRGRLQAKLEEPASRAILNPSDATLPDFVLPTAAGSGLPRDLEASMPVVNLTSKPLSRLVLKASAFDGQEWNETSLESIPAWGVRKCRFKVPFVPGTAPADSVKVTLELREGRSGPLLDRQTVSVGRRKPTDHYRRTFVSAIDESVQYYAVAPSLKPDKSNALVLTVHGASVEASGQANAYKSKDWCTIVAATNRRPYGFDWEDWGRMDAMEAWNLAKKEFPHDPARQVLTGHSMGGHGTWQIGLTYPNEFAAIGPSAGWISFWSYAGGWEPRDPNPVEKMLRRSMNQSDTLLMLRNVLNEDVFILHGDKDDNVPVEQAREMKKHLEDIGAKFQYHEEPGAGHWWGDQCVDWPPMFEMFAKARLPKPGSNIDFEFVTLNPAVSSTFRGFAIRQQADALLPSRLRVSERSGALTISTENILALGIPAAYLHGYTVSIDGNTLPQLAAGPSTSIDFMRSPRGWEYAKFATPGKSDRRSGPFKLAFQNRFVFVVGTRGTLEENTWAANKARFDAEQWYYRGNGAVDIVTDDQVMKDPALRQRNLILYGNTDTNSAFRFVAKCPMQVRRGSVSIGDHHITGTDVAALYLYPEGKRMIGVVAATGLQGMRLADRLPYFTSGVAYPDWTVLRSSVLREGTKRIVGAGFFGNDWRFDPGQSAFLGE